MLLIPVLLQFLIAFGVVRMFCAIPFPVIRILRSPVLVVPGVVVAIIWIDAPLLLLRASAALALAFGCRAVGLFRDLGMRPEFTATGFATFQHDALHNEKSIWNVRDRAAGLGMSSVECRRTSVIGEPCALIDDGVGVRGHASSDPSAVIDIYRCYATLCPTWTLLPRG